ncbi:MAG: glycosyltransferase family 4 protein [Patescibacteria group bacterium]
MKILHTVEFYSPSTGGAQEVVKQISERMVKVGHEVTIATTKLPERKSSTINGVKVVEFDIRGNEVVGMQGETDKYKQFLSSGKFDVVMNYAAQQWATDLAFECLDNISAKKFIVPCGYSSLRNPDFKAYFAKLPKILKKYDGSIYLTKQYRDYKFARRKRLSNLHVIPNGADETEFGNPQNDFDFRGKYGIKNFFILTISNHTGSKGHSETLEVFEKLPFAATLVIIGSPQDDGCFKQCKQEADRINKNRKGKQVLLLTVPRQQTVAALKSADIFLFLSNVEASPIVLFEAAAAGLPFVSNKAGNAAEIAKWTRGGVITRTRPDKLHDGNVFARINPTVKLVKKLHDDEALRRKLGSEGCKNWQANFTWEKIAQRYIDLYEEAVK